MFCNELLVWDNGAIGSEQLFAGFLVAGNDDDFPTKNGRTMNLKETKTSKTLQQS